MPGWYSRLWQALQFSSLAEGLAYAAVLPATLLGLELALGRRLWCRYACPQSVLLALARKASPVALRIGFAPKRCSCARGGEACAAACSLGLEPRRGQGLALECSACGDCVAACRDRGRALSFQMGPGDGGGRESPPRP
jgi:ferredoxin-type protein NapH